MIKANGTIRAALSLALVLAVAGAFTLKSLAAASPDAAPRPAIIVDEPAAAPVGKLTGTGELMIDGAAAQPGATVVSGSRVSTGADGAAVIDLGTLGQVALRPNTTVTITFGAGAVSVKLDGAGAIDASLEAGVTGKVQTAGARLHLRSGEANLRSASGERFLHAGEAVAMTADAEAVIAGGATFTAESDDSERRAGAATNTSTATATEGGAPAPASTTGAPMPPTHGGITSAGLGGVLAMAGVATGVAVGVMAGSNHSSSSATVRPSTVTP